MKGPGFSLRCFLGFHRSPAALRRRGRSLCLCPRCRAWFWIDGTHSPGTAAKVHPCKPTAAPLP